MDRITPKGSKFIAMLLVGPFRRGQNRGQNRGISGLLSGPYLRGLRGRIRGYWIYEVSDWGPNWVALGGRSPGPLNKTFARACDRTSYCLNACIWGPKMGQFWGQIWGPKWGPYLEGSRRG